MTGNRFRYKNDLQFLIFTFLKYFSGECFAVIVATEMQDIQILKVVGLDRIFPPL